MEYFARRQESAKFLPVDTGEKNTYQLYPTNLQQQGCIHQSKSCMGEPTPVLSLSLIKDLFNILPDGERQRLVHVLQQDTVHSHSRN